MSKKSPSWEGHYIGKTEVFKAVNFALKLLNDGNDFVEAISKSAIFYKLPVSTIVLEFMVKEYIDRRNK